MAQCGSFVPASQARIEVIAFTREWGGDNLSEGEHVHGRNDRSGEHSSWRHGPFIVILDEIGWYEYVRRVGFGLGDRRAPAMGLDVAMFGELLSRTL